MDTKKKIIVAIVGLLSIAMLVGFFKLVIFPSNNQNTILSDNFSISTPGVDDTKIERKSKLQNYEREGVNGASGNSIISNLTNLSKVEEDTLIEEPPIIKENLEKKEVAVPTYRKRNKKKSSQKKVKATPVSSADKELQELMALQQELLNQSKSQEANNTQLDNENLETLLQSYSSYTNNYGGQNVEPPLTAERIMEIDGQVKEKIAKAVEEKFKKRSYFQGAGSTNSSDEILGLIPAETVDQGILVNGSTIAIRTKKEVRLSNPKLLIPKGSIVYGRVTMGQDRLTVAINSYKTAEKLYLLDFSIYDYDGREGIQLGNRTWPKIPSKVANDVFDYAYQKGTQAATFGGESQGIQMDEAKTVAGLSAAKEISKEIFAKRRVYMPKKYHLWFNINTK
ncbi:conjugative transposon protein TraM [Aquimarina sp. W85]|uniref:conjugative transposon protein TraM n=1 Tax=Aquimarina rhodophyticola TaxID=3342246 RepID=UPI00366D2207